MLVSSYFLLALLSQDFVRTDFITFIVSKLNNPRAPNFRADSAGFLSAASLKPALTPSSTALGGHIISDYQLLWA